MALDAVRAHDAELTPEQRVAIQALLAPPADAIEFIVPPVGQASSVVIPASVVGRPAAVPPDVEAAIRKAANDFRAEMARRLGSDIPGPIKLVLGTAKNPDYVGVSEGDWSGPGQSYVGCRVTLTVQVTAGEPLHLLNTLAHEVFHCFQHAAYRTLDVRNRAPGWVIEGGAKWVGGDLGGPDLNDDNWWNLYLTHPERPLFARTYDALGFYAHLKETGTDPWTVFKAMFKAVESVPAFAASGATSDAFLDSWASGLIRDPARGRSWDTTGPSITSDSAPVTLTRLGNGDSAAIKAPPYTEKVYALFVSADILGVTATGHARLSDGRVDTTALADSFFCTKPDGCRTCPDGTSIEVPPAPLQSESVLAATGGPAGTAGSLVGLSMEAFCGKAKAVWVHLDRPASKGLLAGRILELISCNGPNGTWNGFMALGGIDAGGGFTVAFARLPLHFTIGGKGTQTAHTTTSGKVPTAVPTLTVTASYTLAITVDPAARRMSITGTGTGGTDLFSFTNALGPGASNLTIEPAPKGRCP